MIRPRFFVRRRIGTFPAGIRSAGNMIGFTLVEVLVALTIAATVATLAASVFSRATDAARRLDNARERLDRRMNARRWLAAAFRSLEVNAEDGATFYGDAQRMRFSSWLLTGDGWHERTVIELIVRGDELTVQLGDDESIALLDHVTFATFDYLTEWGSSARWLAGWRSVVVPPVAVRLRLGRTDAGASGESQGVIGIDTLLFAIGERG